MSYRNKLDDDDQISTEEQIAALIYGYDMIVNSSDPDWETKMSPWPSEDDCADMGRRILALVLMKFRPDLIYDNEWEWNL